LKLVLSVFDGRKKRNPHGARGYGYDEAYKNLTENTEMFIHADNVKVTITNFSNLSYIPWGWANNNFTFLKLLEAWIEGNVNRKKGGRRRKDSDGGSRWLQ
jgi:hypothetical protein